MLPFRVQIEDGQPVSDQLVRAAQRAIHTGEMESGASFPSVRALAQALKISPTTAHKVVLELKEGGYLASRPGVGMVVKTAGSAGEDGRHESLRPACEALLRAAGQLGLSDEDAIAALRNLVTRAPGAGSGKLRRELASSAR